MNDGDLSFHFINSVLVTVVVASFVLWRYRQAILAGMQRGEAVELAVPAAIPVQPSAHLPTDLAAHENDLRRRLVAAWLTTTFLCGLPLAVGYFVAAGSELIPTLLFAYTLCYTLAALPMIAVSLALSPWRIVQMALALLAACLALVLMAGGIERSWHGRPITLKHFQLIPLFLEMAWNQLWMAGIFWLLSWPVRLRGVVPITFAALLLFGLAPLLGARLSGVLAATEFGTPWAISLGLNGIFLLIALPTGWLAWLRLRQVAGDYAAKRVSDAQLLARMWWLMLVVTIGLDILIGRERPLLALALTLGVIALFAPVNRWAMRWFGIARRAAVWSPRTLLVLRMFGYTARTERLFDRVAARWRLIGPVTMIAAPDVAARTIDAGDYLRWLTGRVDELFVTSQRDLDQRLAAIDDRPDPDGRFRVNEFCCRDSTWQATVVELMARADVVIMDLRGLTAGRQGCEFELQQLAQRVPLKRIVLVVDRATDMAQLKTAFGDAMDVVHQVELRHSWQADRVYRAVLAAAG